MTNAPIYARSGERSVHPAPDAYGAARRTNARAAPEHIEHIKDTFRMHVTELADYLGVSAQTVLKWRAGVSEPGDSASRKIRRLSQVADEFHAAGVPRANGRLWTKARDGRTLLDLIAAGEDYSAHLHDLVGMAKRSQAALAELRRATANTPPNDNWRSYISIPGGLEDD